MSPTVRLHREVTARITVKLIGEVTEEDQAAAAGEKTAPEAQVE